MSDIVEQARAIEPYLYQQLADEIERLKAESDISDGLLADAKSEIERLRAALQEISATRTASDWNGKRLDHQAEIARRALEERK
jgi:uncharacterized small protein (DUF1192 family)